MIPSMNQGMAQAQSPTANWIVQPTSNLYDLRAIVQNFNYVFGLDQGLDQNTPSICMAVANEIQKPVHLGHPFRVLMFNALSSNGFANKEFQDLVQVVVTLIYFGSQNREFSSINDAMAKILPHCVSAYAGALAEQTQQLHSYLNAKDTNSMRVASANWAEAVSVATRQVDYSQLGQNAANQSVKSNFTSQLNNNTIPTNMGMQSVSTHSGISGAFSSGDNVKQPTQNHNNNAQIEGTVSPYRAQLDRMQGRLSGSIQESMHQLRGDSADKNILSLLSQVSTNSAEFSEPMQMGPANNVIRPAATGAQASRDFDAEVSKFNDEPILYVEPKDTPAPAGLVDVAPHLATQFSFNSDGHRHEVIGEDLTMTVNTWKSSKHQRHAPVICVRKHRLRFVKTREGFVLAVPQVLSQKEKEVLMDYNAHAIDSSKGIPKPNAKPAIHPPVREEAKILYGSEDVPVDATVVVAQAEDWTTAATVDEVVQTAILDAEIMVEKPEAFRTNAVVITPVVYDNVDAMNRDIATVEKLSHSRNFAKATVVLGQVENAFLRRRLDEILCTKINETLSCEMGITNIRIKNFTTSGGEIEGVVRKHHDNPAADRLLSVQSGIIALACSISDSANIADYATNMLTGEEDDKAHLIAKIAFLKQEVSATWTKYTSEELAISEIPARGALKIEKTLTPTLHALAASVMTGQKEYDFERNYLITSDRVVYTLHKGLFDNRCLLLSALNG